jgi:hypothetical protein
MHYIYSLFGYYSGLGDIKINKYNHGENNSADKQNHGAGNMYRNDFNKEVINPER